MASPSVARVDHFHSGRWITFAARDHLAFGEAFEALVQGLQGALWDLSGVPRSCARQSPRRHR
jgi:hypothetical protein